MIEFISQPWHWSVSGLAIAAIVVLMYVAGERFGVSSSFDTLCTIGGAGKRFAYFNKDWKTNVFQLVFVAGAIIGGFIASHYLASPAPVQIAADTVESLAAIGVSTPQTYAEGSGFIPEQEFTFQNLLTLKGIILMVVGGFLIGFGTRWAGGCTSGHAISGLSNLQLGSLIAVVGFFAGGLLMTHVLFPFIFNL